MKKLGTALAIALTTAVAFVPGSARGAQPQSAQLQLPGLNCGIGLTDQVVPLVLRDSAGRLIPPKAYPFKTACKTHDKCYARWGIGREQCDQAFGLDMHAVCQVQPKAARHGCEYVGEEYHSAVVRKGAAGYKQAQQDTLDNAFNGVYRWSGNVIATGASSGTKSIPWAGTITVTQGRFATCETTGVVTDSELSAIENITEHPSSVTGTSGCGFNVPAGYVGGTMGFELAFHWGGGILPMSITGTFTGYSLVDNAYQEDVVFSGGFLARKS